MRYRVTAGSVQCVNVTEIEATRYQQLLVYISIPELMRATLVQDWHDLCLMNILTHKVMLLSALFHTHTDMETIRPVLLDSDREI